MLSKEGQRKLKEQREQKTKQQVELERQLIKTAKLARDCLQHPSFVKYRDEIKKLELSLEKYATELIKTFDYKDRESLSIDLMKIRYQYEVLTYVLNEVYRDAKYEVKKKSEHPFLANREFDDVG